MATFPLYAWQVHAFYLSNPELSGYLTLGAKGYLLIRWPVFSFPPTAKDLEL